jgi:hypothetical protein
VSTVKERERKSKISSSIVIMSICERKRVWEYESEWVRGRQKSERFSVQLHRYSFDVSLLISCFSYVFSSLTLSFSFFHNLHTKEIGSWDENIWASEVDFNFEEENEMKLKKIFFNLKFLQKYASNFWLKSFINSSEF